MAEKNTRKRWLLVILAVAVVWVVIAAISGRNHSPLVTVVEVTREPLTSYVTSNGKVEPVSPYVARALYPTFVSSVKATEGQGVRKGELILTLDDSDVRAQLAQARATLLQAQVELRNARAGGPPDEIAQLSGDLEKARVQVANLTRQQKSLEKLVAEQAATRDELAQNRAALAQAQANLGVLEAKRKEQARRASENAAADALAVSQAQDQVRGLEAKVNSATVISPLNGTLYSLPVRTGDFVKLGDVVAEMADLEHVRVRAFVDEPDLGSLAKGQEVQVTWDAHPGEVWSGQTEDIPKQVVSRGARSVGEVLCSVENPKLTLIPNINVTVRILVANLQSALVIPRGAVGFDRGQRYVFVFNGEKLHRQNITVGAASNVKYEVLSGLKEGDKIALPGEAILRDGMRITPVVSQ
ncbi:MAG TPA: efflux RND transporter periplasmic adaptor subunit [Verrucomicrobiae bacterium]|nr:efflux RND transporter periplasmic adaptor subunit [Verrucomicrobiae bacterium]